MINKHFILGIATACSIATQSFAATMLNVGDITFVGYSNDDDFGAGFDQFAFVTWVTLDATTEVQFTDYGWSSDDNSFTTGATQDDSLTWSTNGSSVAAGTLVVITANGTSSSVANGVGAITAGGIGPFSSSGESLFAYTGTEANPSFIFGLYTHQATWDIASNVDTDDSLDSNLPTELGVTGGNLIPVIGTSPNDNGLWDSDKDGVIFANLDEAKAHALNPANWVIENEDDGSGAFSDDLLADINLAAGGTFNLVPEPSTSLSLLLGLSAFCFSRRRN